MDKLSFESLIRSLKTYHAALIFTIFFFSVTASPGFAQKLIPEDTLKAESDTIPVVPPAKDGFFSFPMLKNPFFDMDFDFGSSFSSMGTNFSQDFSTDLNIEVKDKKVIVTAQIPGSDKNNININVTNNTISISAEMKIEETLKDDKGNVISSSNQMRQFSNSQPLPVEVKPDVSKTDYKDGVLTIELKRT
ncbi:MAG: Hsp20/alpha crystallin family protein [Fibrobacteria bacterium]|nr:Hsp20/alpha crystallin family protein [Fibrobacteria bacterium]